MPRAVLPTVKFLRHSGWAKLVMKSPPGHTGPTVQSSSQGQGLLERRCGQETRPGQMQLSGVWTEPLCGSHIVPICFLLQPQSQVLTTEIVAGITI